MRARDAFDRTTARLLAQRVKKKFTNPEEDIANVRVMANGVAATGGQVYNADVAGHRPGTVVKAINVGSKAKAHYVAQYGNGGVTINDVRKLIDSQLKKLGLNDKTTNTFQTEIPLDQQLFRSTQGPTTGSSASFNVPSDASVGDLLLIFYSEQYNSHTDGSSLSGTFSNGGVIVGAGTWRYEPGATTYFPPDPRAPNPKWNGFNVAVGMYQIDSGDIGTTLTYTLYATDYASLGITYFVLLRREAFYNASTDSYWNVNYRFYENSSLNQSPDFEVIFYFASSLGYGTYENADNVETPASATVLTHATAGGNSLLVAYGLGTNSPVVYPVSVITNSYHHAFGIRRYQPDPL